MTKSLSRLTATILTIFIGDETLSSDVVAVVRAVALIIRREGGKSEDMIYKRFSIT